MTYKGWYAIKPNQTEIKSKYIHNNDLLLRQETKKKNCMSCKLL